MLAKWIRPKPELGNGVKKLRLTLSCNCLLKEEGRGLFERVQIGRGRCTRAVFFPHRYGLEKKKEVRGGKYSRGGLTSFP